MEDNGSDFLQSAGENDRKPRRIAFGLLEMFVEGEKAGSAMFSAKYSDDDRKKATKGEASAEIEEMTRKIGDLDLHNEKCSGLAVLPELRVLDISGTPGNFDAGVFGRFLKNHEKLEFLGALMTNIGLFGDVTQMENLEVAGEANAAQIVCALRTYSVNNREHFCSRSLYNAFQGIHHRYSHFNPDQLYHLLNASMAGLQSYPTDLSVQMAGTACLYNLCTKERAAQWDSHDLKKIVDRCLDAAEYHPTTIQLHKNVWLTICNDHILQAETIDMYRCCCVALESMCANGDSAITRMTVAIVSILAAKVPTTRMWRVGNNERYMRFLVGVLRQKLEEWEEAHGDNQAPPLPPDVTLKFTLSALWNLTDESPSTCRQFLRQRGLETVLNVLEKFPNNSVRTKVLGLLNNVAEVPELRFHLLSEKCLCLMIMLLGEEKIDVSYFSAGVLANLGAKERWDLEPDWNTCMSALVERISNWSAPESEMVAYRSFRPFFPLLESCEIPGVQLWAVWAIRHVCLRNRDRYRDMFQDQGGVDAVAGVKRRLEEEERRGVTLNPGQLQVKEIVQDILTNMID